MTIRKQVALVAGFSALIFSCGGGGKEQPGAGAPGTTTGSTGSTGNTTGGFRTDPGEVNPADTSIDGSCANTLTGPYDDTLEVPTLHWVEPDDFSARFDWSKKDSYYDPDI